MKRRTTRPRDRLPGSRIERGWQIPLPDLAARLSTDVALGLTTAQAAERLARDGPNELPAGRGPTVWDFLREQVGDFMTLVLLAAAAVSWMLGEEADALTIVAIVVLNTFLGVIQEYRAEQAIASLSRFQAPRARVIRSGRVVEVPARELVLGDLVLLEEGDRVPADARLIESHGMQTEESALTGESVPVVKASVDTPSVDAAATPSDMPHVAFTGTTVVSGTGRAVVVATGAFTELGHIARMVAQSPSAETPLQHSLNHLGRWLVAVTGAAVAVVFAVGIAQGQPWLSMLMVAISLAVAAIPEGLPAAVTAALALGVQRMSRRRAIVRRLSAVESLGCASVICADKTGTLTRNAMTLVRVHGAWGTVEVRGDGFEPRGDFVLGGVTVDPLAIEPLKRLLVAGVLCGHADVIARGRRWEAVGDPTEAALVAAARKAGLDPVALRRRRPALREAPFQAQRRMMSVAAAGGEIGAGSVEVFAKGAPDAVLSRCTRHRAPQGERPLSPADRARYLAEAERLAGQGLRVLGVAARRMGVRALPGERDTVENLAESLERDLTFLGLVGLRDPPRPDVAQAVARARRAHVRTVMITGDHPATARAIARAVGLSADDEPVTGVTLERMDDDTLRELLQTRHVFARVSPAHKRRMVRALRDAGYVVAMTGDGVNDAPALKEADIGIAMGLAGTDVARQSASLVLADDNYATIVDAIEEGRTIYENIRRFIRYLLGCNAGEVLTMLGAGVLGLPVPMTALQILWVNLVTDGLPALALGLLPPSPRIMERPPRPRTESLFARGAGEEIVEQGLIISTTTLMVFGAALGLGANLGEARTAAFASLVLSQLLYALSLGRGAGRARIVPPVLAAGVAISLWMQAAVMFVPALQEVFATQALDARLWQVVAGGSTASYLLRAAGDWVTRRAGQLRARFASRLSPARGPW